MVNAAWLLTTATGYWAEYAHIGIRAGDEVKEEPAIGLNAPLAAMVDTPTCVSVQRWQERQRWFLICCVHL